MTEQVVLDKIKSQPATILHFFRPLDVFRDLIGHEGINELHVRSFVQVGGLRYKNFKEILELCIGNHTCASPSSHHSYSERTPLHAVQFVQRSRY